MSYFIFNEDAFKRVNYARCWMQLVYEMMAERYQIEMIHWMKLIKLKDKYTKKFQEINVLEINGSRMLISELICEFSVTADLSKMITDGMNAADGPLAGMDLWIKEFDKGNDGQRTKEDYQSVIVKFDEGNAKIEKNMTHYHTSMTSLDTLNKRLENLRLKCLRKPEKELSYQKEVKVTLERIQKIEKETCIYKEKYEMSLQNEKNERHSFKNTITDIKARFDHFQEGRLLAMFGFVKHFVFWLQKLDTERDNRKLILQKITDVIDSRNPKQEVLQWDLEFMEKTPYPVFKEYSRKSKHETRAIAFESQKAPITSAKKLAIPKQDYVTTEENPSHSLGQSVSKQMKNTSKQKRTENYQDEVVQPKPSDLQIQNNPELVATNTEGNTVCHNDRASRTKSAYDNEKEILNIPCSKSVRKSTEPKVKIPGTIQDNAILPKPMFTGENNKETKDHLSHRMFLSEVTQPVSENTNIIRVHSKDKDLSQKSLDDKMQTLGPVSSSMLLDKRTVTKFKTECVTEVLKDRSAKEKFEAIQIEDIDSFSDDSQPKPVDKPTELNFKHAKTPASSSLVKATKHKQEDIQLEDLDSFSDDSQPKSTDKQTELNFKHAETPVSPSPLKAAKQKQEDIRLDDIDSFSDDSTSVENIKNESNFKITQSFATHQSADAAKLKLIDDQEDKLTTLLRCKTVSQPKGPKLKRLNKAAEPQQEKIATPNSFEVKEEDGEMPLYVESVIKPTATFTERKENSVLHTDKGPESEPIKDGQDGAPLPGSKIANNQTGPLSSCSVKMIDGNHERAATPTHAFTQGNEKETVVKINSKPKQPTLVQEDTDSSDEDEPQPNGSDDINIGKLTNVKVISLEDYTATRQGELTFKMGQIIRQTSATNDQGMAFGYIRKGRLRLRKHGFYPINIVVLKVKSRKTKEKKPKQSQKRVKHTKDKDHEQVDIQVVRMFQKDQSSDTDCKTAASKSQNQPKKAFGTLAETSNAETVGTNRISKAKIAFEDLVSNAVPKAPKHYSINQSKTASEDEEDEISVTSEVAFGNPPENTVQKGSKCSKGNKVNATSVDVAMEIKSKRSKNIFKRLFKRHKDE